MSINVKIRRCGPISPPEEISLEIPSKGICLIVGPNMSGKSVLASAITSLLNSIFLVKYTHPLLGGDLASRLFNPSNAVSEIFHYKEENSEINLIDPLEIFTLEIPAKDAKEYYRALDAVLRKNSNNLLDLEGYLKRTLFIYELATILGIEPWISKRFDKGVLSSIDIDLSINDKIHLKAKVPPLNPTLETDSYSYLYKTIYIMDTSINKPLLCGISLGHPLSSYKKLFGNGLSFPSLNLIKLFKSYEIPVDTSPRFFNLLYDTYLMSELKDAKILPLFEKMYPSVMIKLNDVIIPQDLITSPGIANLIFQQYAFEGIETLCKILDIPVVVSIDTPEAGLETYTIYNLAKVYAEIVSKFNLSLVIVTHSEVLVKGLEDLATKKEVNLKVYETIGTGQPFIFTINECPVTDEGIMNIRFIKIAKKLIEMRLNMD